MAGVYIHIPFCRSKCAYCDFYSLGKFDKSLHEVYLQALENEWRSRRHELSEEINTVYIGGGTPSSLSVEHLSRICSFFEQEANISEFTIEVNPEDVDDILLSYLSSGPINRVSMGVQSLIDDELKFIGRRHSADKAEQAVKELRTAGIHNISCDLIFGLPHQTLDSWKYSIDRMITSIRPEHLSAYLLSYEHGTRLNAMLSKGIIQEADDGLISDMYAYLCETTSANGYEHYEISNYALQGCRSRHNSSYWEYTPYLGIGPGAHSFNGSYRTANLPDLRRYIAANGIVGEDEHLSPTEKQNERIMVGLRTKEGIDISRLDGYNKIRRAALPYISSGQLILDDDRILRVPETSWLMTDAMLVDLFL